MATILDKDITRETTVKVDDREIQITLTEDQKIVMKLKGMKSGSVEISIESLFNQLRGDVPKEKKPISFTHQEEDDKPMAKNDLSSYKGDSKYLISIHDIRQALNVKDFDYDTIVKFDSFFSELIKERKEGLKNKKITV